MADASLWEKILLFIVMITSFLAGYFIGIGHK